MPSVSDDHFVVRKDIYTNCLVLYTMDDWNSQAELIKAKINRFDPEHNIFLRNFSMGTAILELDASNRLLIPRKMLDSVGIDKDIVLLGLDGKIELWATEAYEKNVLGADDFSALAKKLLS